MDPLQSVPLPSHGVLLEIDTLNSWPTAEAKHIVRLAEGETVCISLFQAGATTYYPPQQVDDAQ